jgi:hypothetical protein
MVFVNPTPARLTNLLPSLGFHAQVCIVFLLAYFALEQLRRGRRRLLLGRLHVAGCFLAGVLVFLGSNLVPLGLGRYGFASFGTGTLITVIGIAFLVVSQLFFVAVVLDALRRGPEPR